MLILNYSHVETEKQKKAHKSTSIKWEQIPKDIRSKPEEQQLGVSTKRRDRSLEQQGD